MEDSRKNFLTNYIISGVKFVKIDGERYKIVSPSLELKFLAEYVYEETVESLRFDNFMSQDQIKATLYRLDTWIDKDDEDLEILENFLEEQKVVLYQAAFDHKTQDKARVNIRRSKKAIFKALARKHSLAHTTLDYHATSIKHKFITALCMRDKDNKSVYTEESFWSSSSPLLEKAMDSLRLYSLAVEEFREIARSDPWRTIWGVGKEQCFGTPSSHWTDEQRTLVIFSKMYDNAHQSNECPSDEVFEDDDMFDGWMIVQKRKREEEQKKQQTDAVNTTDFGNAGEVFISAPTNADAKKIYDLNEATQRRTIKERAAVIEKRGKVQAANMPDTQRALVNQMAEQYRQQKH